jgi:hypothetical protein
MPRKKRPASELTDKELAKRVFPSGVRKQLEKLVLQLDEKPRRQPSKRKPKP